MPIGAEALVLQTLDGALSEVTILKAAAGQDDSRLADPLRDGDDGFGKGVVAAGGEEGDGDAAV